MVITDRKLADPEKAVLLRVGYQDVSATAAPDGASGRWRPHRPAGGLQPEIGAGGSEPLSDDRAAERANAWGLPSSRRYRHVTRARTSLRDHGDAPSRPM